MMRSLSGKGFARRVSSTPGKMDQTDFADIHLVKLLLRLRIKMMMEGIYQQLKRHPRVVDQRLRLRRGAERALRETERFHQPLNTVEGE